MPDKTIVIKLRIVADDSGRATAAFYKAVDAAQAGVRETPGVVLAGTGYGMKDGHDSGPG